LGESERRYAEEQLGRFAVHADGNAILGEQAGYATFSDEQKAQASLFYRPAWPLTRLLAGSHPKLPVLAGEAMEFGTPRRISKLVTL
jgi:hypothetical protein